MTSYALVKKNASGGWLGYISLSPLTSTGHILTNPTLAAGDVTISIDGGSFANLGTLPAVTPASSGAVKITLSQAETNGDNLVIKFIDQTSPAEWCDVTINMRTAARQIDDLAFPATSGNSMVVDSAGLVDANAVKHGPSGAGTAQTARDIGASVLLSAGTGTGQLDFTSGVVKANATQWLGGTIPAVNVTGVPLVDLKYTLGTLSPAAAGYTAIDWGQVTNKTTTNVLSGTTIGTLTTYTGNTVQTGDSFARLGVAGVGLTNLGDTRIANLDATVSSRMATYTQPTGFLAATFPSGTVANTTNITSATGIDVTKWSGQSVVTPNSNGVPIVDTRQLIRQGTAQSTGNSTTAIKLDSSASATDSFYKGMRCAIISGTGSPEAGLITAYVGSTKIATISPAWPTAPDNTSIFQIFPAMVDVETWGEVAVNALVSGRVDASIGANNAGNLTANLIQVNAHAVTDTASGILDVNAKNHGGTAQTGRDIGASVLLSTGTGTGQLDFTSGIVKANVTQLLGTAWLTPGTAGTPDVNTLKIGGTTQTARDIGASVLLSSGTGTGQLDFTSGVTKANATQWLGGTIPAVNVTGVPLVDLKYTLGTISPATAGSVRADSVTGAVGSVTGLTASNLDTTVSSRMATYTQPTGFLAATFPAGTVANTTNITAGTITTTTNLTNAATAGDFTSTMKTSLNNSTPASITGAVGSVTGAVGSVTGLTASNLDTTISSRMATYTQPTGFLAATFPSGTLSNTTNITAGTITTASNLTTNNDKTGYALTSGERNSISDAMLDRDMSTGTDSGSPSVRTVRQALRFLRNKWSISSGTLTVNKEDDSTASWTSTITTDAAAGPVITSDPA